MSYATEQEILNVRWNAAELACRAEEQRMRPSAIFKPVISADGASWCALLGENLQTGVAGFGNTPEEAMQSFDKAWNEKK